MDKALEGLERAGLLGRPGPVGPGYARRVRLTRAGTVLVERCRAPLLDIEHLMLQRFSAEPVDLLQQFLKECAA
jgi:DNA-binding MarR family transcriptional regulator